MADSPGQGRSADGLLLEWARQVATTAVDIVVGEALKAAGVRNVPLEEYIPTRTSAEGWGGSVLRITGWPSVLNVLRRPHVCRQTKTAQ